MIAGEVIFTEGELPSGDIYTVVDGKGKHYFKALIKFNIAREKNPLENDFLPYLIEQLVWVNREQVTVEQLREMDMADVNYLFTVLATQIDKLTIK